MRDTSTLNRRLGLAFLRWAAAPLTALLLSALPPFAGAAEKPFVIAFPGGAYTLDAHGRDETTTISIQMHMFDTLIFTGIDGELEPALATSWKPVSDTKWRLKLREGVRFHDGVPFTAKVAAESLLRAKGKGFAKSHVKKFTVGIKAVHVIDDSTIEIDTGKPWPALPDELTGLRMVPIHYIKEVGNAAFALKPIGTGPYKFVEWVKDDHIDLVANEDYWKGAPSIKRVRIRPIPIGAARTAGILSGELDVVWGISPVDGAKLEKNPNVNVFRTATQRTMYMHFDVYRDKGGPYKAFGPVSPGLPKGAPNPFLKRKVRQAVIQTVDVKRLIRTIMHGSGVPATQMIPPQAFGYNKRLKRLPHDPAKAKRLLAEAGFPNGFDVRLDCSNDRYINDGALCLAISGMLTNVGIRTTPNPRPKSVFFSKLSKGDFALYMAGYGGTQVGAAMNAILHTRDLKAGYGQFNRGHYSNKEVDELIENAASEMNVKKRQALYERAWEIGLRDQAWLPLFQNEAIIATQKNIELKPRFNEWVLAQEITVKSKN